MNRYPLNSQVIGVGAGRPLSVASAFQALYLIGLSTRATVFQHGGIADTLGVASHAHGTVYRIFMGAETMSLRYHADVHQWIKVYGKAVQNFALRSQSVYRRLITFGTNTVLYARSAVRMVRTRLLHPVVDMTLAGAVEARKAILAPVDQFMSLAPVVTARKAMLEVFLRALTLATSIKAEDVPTAMAAPDRTAVVGWFTRQVIVPAAEFSGGRKATLDVQTGTAPTGSSGSAPTSGEFNFTGKLDDLRDVESKNATPGEVLTYENGEWKPTKIDGGEF